MALIRVTEERDGNISRFEGERGGAALGGGGELCERAQELCNRSCQSGCKEKTLTSLTLSAFGLPLLGLPVGRSIQKLENKEPLSMKIHLTESNRRNKYPEGCGPSGPGTLRLCVYGRLMINRFVKKKEYAFSALG